MYGHFNRTLVLFRKFFFLFTNNKKISMFAIFHPPINKMLQFFILIRGRNWKSPITEQWQNLLNNINHLYLKTQKVIFEVSVIQVKEWSQNMEYNYLVLISMQSRLNTEKKGKDRVGGWVGWGGSRFTRA